jgi:hypothetical protein
MTEVVDLTEETTKETMQDVEQDKVLGFLKKQLSLKRVKKKGANEGRPYLSCNNPQRFICWVPSDEVQALEDEMASYPPTITAKKNQRWDSLSKKVDLLLETVMALQGMWESKFPPEAKRRKR